MISKEINFFIRNKRGNEENMKKLLYTFLSVMIAIVSLYIPGSETGIINVSAKISGDYSYEVLSNDTVSITNYNGSARDVIIPETIDGLTVKKIGYGSFAEVKSIVNVTIPNTVTTIDSYAFSKCSQLEQIVIPNSVVAINQNAFSGCTNLQSIDIPTSLISLSYGVFFGCKSLESVTIPNGIETIGGMAFGGCTKLADVEIPNSVTFIGNNAFSDCITLETIEIPEGIKSVGSSVFSGCYSLKNVDLPETLESVGLSAFQDCINLERIDLPDSVEAIGYAAFSGCAKLKEFNIPAKVTNLGNAMFSGCSSLERIDIPDTVTSIGENIFSGCVNLREVNLNDNITSIGQSAFSYCRSLERIKLPKNIKTINVSLFRYCDNLESVVVPAGVTEINSTAFSDCMNLKSVTLPHTFKSKEDLGSRIFSNSPNVVVLLTGGSSINPSIEENYAINNKVNYITIQEGFNLDRESLSLSINEDYRMNIIQSPYSIVDNKKVTWSSSDTSVVEVDENGVIKAVGAGEATIRIRNSYGQEDTCIVNVDDTKVEIESIVLEEHSLVMKKGKKTGISATINPKNTTEDKGITWSTSDPEIAMVSSTGIIFAKKPGTVSITGTTSNGLQDTCEVTVISEISSVSMNVTAIRLDIGNEQTLRASIDPVDTTDDKTLTWKSSNEKVATVDQNGKVTAIAKGTSTITVRAINGRTAECVVTVNTAPVDIPISSVALDLRDVSMEAESTKQLTATILPTNTTMDKALTWSSSQPDVVSVDGKGLLTAHKEGSATISVTTINGKTAECTVNVQPKTIAIDSVQLNTTEVTLRQDKTYVLETSVLPENTTMDKTITWSSEDETIAYVDEAGMLHTVAPGTVAVTATSVNGKTATCNVTVLAWDTTALTALLAEARTYAEADYTIETYQKLVSAMNDATMVMENTSALQADVDQALTNLQTAIDNLELRINIDTLQALIEKLDTYKEDDYTVQSYEAMAVNLTAAKDAIATGEISHADIVKYVESLHENETALVSVVELKVTIAIGEQIKKDGFTTESYAVLEEALREANQQLIDGTTTSVADAVTRIQDSIKNLVAVEDNLTIYKQILNNAILKAQELEKNGALTNVNEIVAENFRKCLDEAVFAYANEKATKDTLMSAWTNLAEAMQYLDFTADKSMLSSLVKECNELDLSKYLDDENMKEFISAKTEAQTVLDSETALDERIQASYTRLSAAKSALVLKEDVIQTATLDYLLTVCADAMNNKDYYDITSDSWAIFETALSEAKAARAAMESQAAIDLATSKLASAYENIRLIANEDILSELKSFVKSVDELDMTLYSEADTAYFLNARSVIVNMIDTESFTTKEYEEAIKMMANVEQRMVDGVIVPEEPTVPEVPEQPSTPEVPETPQEPSEQPSDIVENVEEVETPNEAASVQVNNTVKPTGVATGDVTRFGIISLWFAGSGVALAISSKKKKTKKGE